MKGIATQTLFYILIGVAVIALAVGLIVFFVGPAKESSSCIVSKNTYCQQWSSHIRAGGARTSTESDNIWSQSGADASCVKPVDAACKRSGYDIP